jgi:hypothetical protein
VDEGLVRSSQAVTQQDEFEQILNWMKDGQDEDDEESGEEDERDDESEHGDVQDIM